MAALRRPLGPRRPAALPPTGGKRGLKLKLDDDEDEVEPTSESTRDDLSLLVRSYADTLPFDQSDVFPLERLITARLDRAIAARRRKTSLPGRTAEIARFRRLGVVGGLDAIHIGVVRDRSADARAAAREAHAYPPGRGPSRSASSWSARSRRSTPSLPRTT